MGVMGGGRARGNGQVRRGVGERGEVSERGVGQRATGGPGDVWQDKAVRLGRACTSAKVANNTVVVGVGVRDGGQEARVNGAQPWISVGTTVNSLHP